MNKHRLPRVIGTLAGALAGSAIGALAGGLVSSVFGALVGAWVGYASGLILEEEHVARFAKVIPKKHAPRKEPPPEELHSRI